MKQVIKLSTYEEKKAAVLAIPIQQYLHDIIVPARGGYYGAGEGFFATGQFERCPFHNEDTGSFKLYPETNSCYCFGCRVGGNIFALHKEFMAEQTGSEPSFREMLDELYQYSQSSEINSHTTVSERYKLDNLKEWQNKNKIQLAVLSRQLYEKFDLPLSYNSYKVLCEIERMIKTCYIDFNEVTALLNKI